MRLGSTIASLDVSNMGSGPRHGPAPRTILRRVASVGLPGRFEFLDFNAPLSDSRADSIAASLARIHVLSSTLDVDGETYFSASSFSVTRRSE
jgi:hypothetical protein